jgi:hypothetical protein
MNSKNDFARRFSKIPIKGDMSASLVLAGTYSELDLEGWSWGGNLQLTEQSRVPTYLCNLPVSVDETAFDLAELQVPGNIGVIEDIHKLAGSLCQHLKPKSALRT